MNDLIYIGCSDKTLSLWYETYYDPKTKLFTNIWSDGNIETYEGSVISLSLLRCPWTTSTPQERNIKP